MEIIGNMLRECFAQGLVGRLDDKRDGESISDWFARLNSSDDEFVSYFHGVYNDE